MRGFPNGAENRNQERADADEDGANERVSGESFAQDQGGEYGIENKSRLYTFISETGLGD